MGAPIKMVNTIASKVYYDDETKSFDEEIRYWANYLMGSCPTYHRQGGNQSWRDLEKEQDWHAEDRDHD